jgi:hypothetical protein
MYMRGRNVGLKVSVKEERAAIGREDNVLHRLQCQGVSEGPSLDTDPALF